MPRSAQHTDAVTHMNMTGNELIFGLHFSFMDI